MFYFRNLRESKIIKKGFIIVPASKKKKRLALKIIYKIKKAKKFKKWLILFFDIINKYIEKTIKNTYYVIVNIIKTFGYLVSSKN